MFDDMFKKFIKNFDGSMDDILKDFDELYRRRVLSAFSTPYISSTYPEGGIF